VPGTTKLRLIGGVGEYYEEALKKRLEIDMNDQSPTALVYRIRRPLVCNDAKNSPEAQLIRNRYKDEILGAALNKIGAFVDYPVLGSDSRCMGVINMSSPKAWCFTQSFLQSLVDIGRRIDVLVGHVRHRVAEERAITEAKFLQEIKPKLKPGPDLHTALQQQAEQARQAAQAHVVSCFLWDESRQSFILRAEAGWTDHDWLGAASYKESEGMTGKLALRKEPQYIDDLIKFKKNTNEKPGKYIKQMFGTEPDEGTTYEVLALPLTFQEEILGVLTMHRATSLPVEKHKTGFATCEKIILAEASRTLSTYVAALHYYDGCRWQFREMKRLAEVGQLFAEDQPFLELMPNICKRVLEQYGARAVAMYLSTLNRKGLDKVAYKELCPGKYDFPDHIEPSKDLRWIAFASATCQPPAPVISNAEDNPLEIRKHSRIERICLPLFIDDRNVLGILDIRWKGEPRPDKAEPLPRHDPDYLLLMARQVASALQAQKRRKAKPEEMSLLWSQRALDGMALMLRKSSHDFAKNVQGIINGLNRLARRGLTSEQSSIVDDCKKYADSIAHMLNRARTTGTKLRKLQLHNHELHTLLYEAINKYRPTAEEAGIIISESVHKVKAQIDATLILESIENVIDNAIDAMPDGGVLDISMRLLDTNCTIIVSDTGSGMTRSQIKQFESIDNGIDASPKGMGLFLTSLACEAHGGRFEIASSPGAGTTVKLIIPIA
jgi:signal transduction histidine kinase